MATFFNQATLTYNGQSTNSNIVSGEIVDFLTAAKSSLDTVYREGDTVTYLINLVNSGTTPVTDVTIDDDLGGYLFGTGTVYPLTADALTVVDTFNPPLSNLSVTYNGTPWTEGTEYSYTGSTFSTNPGVLSVPAATYAPDPNTGAWITTPGVSTLVVRGTV